MAAMNNKKVSSRKIKKSREELNAEGRERKRQKKHRGNPAGSRLQELDGNKNNRGCNEERDPRIGSKKPVSLIATEKTIKTVKPKAEKVAEKTRLSPQDELTLLENDDKLDALLERVEQGETLTEKEQNYIDTKLDRIDTLMEILGISFEDDEEEEEEKKDDIMQLLKGK